MSDSPDLNQTIAGVLSDMAFVQTVKEKQKAFRRAADALRTLPASVDALIDSEGQLSRIPHIGPSSLQIIREVLETGRSSRVDRAIADSGRQAEVHERRRFRQNYMSRALANHVLSVTEFSVLSADFQMHSVWSDGSETLDQMVEGCLARGYTHAAMTDHSAGLAIARGMSEEKIGAQRTAIDEVNERSGRRFRLLQGIEANIGADGDLDVPEAMRMQIDIVLAAPHAALRSTAPQTDRFLTVVRARAVHILAHPTGRKYDSRSPIVANWRRIFNAAAEAGVAIEIDGDPSRQDCSFELAAEAEAAGCLFALDSDAHATDELWYTDMARAHAALAGIPPDRVINTWPLDRLLAWAERRRGSP